MRGVSAQPTRHSTLRWGLAVLVAASQSLERVRANHYICNFGEVQGEVQGESGLLCSPTCNPSTFECPLDVPPGTTAEPQCMLQDASGGFKCGLLCQLDTQCPSGDTCRNLGIISVCMRPLSFTEWASSSSTRQRLNVAFPQRSGSASAGFQVAKAYAALQNLKKKYAISEGDPDVLIFHELLMSVHGLSQMPQQAASVVPGFPQPVILPNSNPGAAAASGGSGRAGLFGQLKGDFDHLASNLRDGLPGIERELEDTEWNFEHGRYWSILRDFTSLFLFYLIGGSAYKYQTEGARGIHMLPHIGFWMEYPNLVRDGVTYLRILVTGSAGSYGYKFSDGPHLRTSARDAFSTYEPTL